MAGTAHRSVEREGAWLTGLIVVTDRILTLPNVLSIARLFGVPLFLWLVLGPEEDGWALVVLMVSGFTDCLDG